MAQAAYANAETMDKEEEEAMKENMANLQRKATERMKKKMEKPDETDPLSDKGLYEEVEAAFEKYDANKDGKLSLEECKEYLEGWL